MKPSNAKTSSSRLFVNISLVMLFSCMVVEEARTAVGPNGCLSQANSAQSPVKLELRIPKTVWRVGESNECTAFIRNTSETPYFVGRHFFGFGIISSFHNISLKIVDAKTGKEVSRPQISVTQQWTFGTSLSAKIDQEYVKLEKDMIHGLSVNGDWGLKPGNYRISASYTEWEAESWPAAERGALPNPVWMEPLASNTVSITVVRELRHRP